MMEKITARYGRLDAHRAVIEMAAASGLPLVPIERRNPLLATSYGTGELIRHALDQGFTDISIAIGGSATNDGGMGCARALGVRFLDSEGRELEGRGEDLEKVSTIDISTLDHRISSSKITVMCDVTNPLCGENGATWTFGAQKGATPEMQVRLEAGMTNYRDVIRRQFDIDPDAIKGAGAAGGLGAALMVFLGGEMKSGIDTVLDLIDFDGRLEGTDLVVTGEGRTDWQSCFGKVMQGVGERAARKGVIAVGLSGSLGRDAAQIFDHGIVSLMTTVDAPMPLEEAMSRAKELYYLGAVRMFRFIKAGMDLKM
jgi:glycerate kinase